MGREKKRKPHAPRHEPLWRTPKLKALKPPGGYYADHAGWWDLKPGQVPDMDPSCGDREKKRIMRLAPAYGGQIPPAALVLDGLIGTGTVLLITPSGAERRIPVAYLAEVWKTPPGISLADFIHSMHADGLFLLTDAAQLRPVLGTPANQYGRWLFFDAATQEQRNAAMVTTAAELAAHGRDPGELRAYADAVAARVLDGHGDAR
jgi:hypothetical protein